jgi:hypothetical protein
MSTGGVNLAFANEAFTKVLANVAEVAKWLDRPQKQIRASNFLRRRFRRFSKPRFRQAGRYPQPLQKALCDSCRVAMPKPQAAATSRLPSNF